jgi:hypothetical protein
MGPERREMKSTSTILTMVLLAASLTQQPLAFAGAEGMTNHRVVAESLRGLPDLRVRGVTMGDPTLGEFSVLLQNIGAAKAPACRLRLSLKDKSGQVTSIVEVDQPPIEPKGFAKLKVSTDKGLAAYQKYEITTDYSNTVAESDERNNTWSGNTGKV